MSEVLLQHLLRRSADRWPDHPAIVMDGRRMTYAELEASSNRFARTLTRHGIGRGDRVALWLPKSPESIVAIYGVMKAGAAYVSVDASAPIGWLRYIARDCKVAALLSVSARASELALEFTEPGPTLIFTGASVELPATACNYVSWAEVESEDVAPLEIPAKDTDLAYILYTSGSTGRPKGVMISHQSAFSFVQWAGDTFAISHEDRLANHAGLHFDLSTFDLFTGARAGASVYPVPPSIAPFPAALGRLWSAQELTVWYATPSTLILLMSRGGLATAKLSSLRVVLFAGEVFPIKQLSKLMALVPQARFANLYGPTETNVCTWYEITSPPTDDRPLPIGRPCRNCDVVVLDDDGGVVADGEVGELWVSGSTLMRGYWGRPELTRRSLKEVQFAPGVRKLAYKTGDLVCWIDDNLRFIGRRDHQIKTRGYRVELGEIEFALGRHPAVEQAVVLAIPDQEIGNRLRAVVVPKEAVVIDESELKRHCSELLPRYMIPEAIELRRSLPRTASDKVNRETLLRMALGIAHSTETESH